MFRTLLSGAAIALIVGACGGAPSTGPTQRPGSSAAPVASVAASGQAPAGSPPCAEQTTVDGRYLLEPERSSLPMPLTMELRAGWEGCGLSFKSPSHFEARTPGGLMIGFWVVDNVYEQPCAWDGGLFEPKVGSTVLDLATALGAQAITDADPPARVRIDGYDGLYVRLSLHGDIEIADCDQREFRIWDAIQDDSVYWCPCTDFDPEAWILDVDGHRIVIQGGSSAGTDAADLGEMHALVESVHFLTE
jgi:hypothetical protein